MHTYINCWYSHTHFMRRPTCGRTQHYTNIAKRDWAVFVCGSPHNIFVLLLNFYINTFRLQKKINKKSPFKTQYFSKKKEIKWNQTLDYIPKENFVLRCEIHINFSYLPTSLSIPCEYSQKRKVNQWFLQPFFIHNFKNVFFVSIRLNLINNEKYIYNLHSLGWSISNMHA